MATTTKRPKPPTTEVGTLLPGYAATSAGQWWSTVFDEMEYVPELKWPRSARTYDRMRRDGQIKGMNYALTLPVRQQEWRIDPNGMDSAKARALADNFGLKLVGDADGPQKRAASKFNWDDFLREALLALTFGFMFFEQVCNVDMQASPPLSYRKLAPRFPTNVDEIRVAEDGGLSELVQGGDKHIPVSQLVAFVWEREGGNWYGHSVWRGAYKYWALKDTLMKINAITLERNGMGIPWAEITDRDVDDTTARQALAAATSSRAAKKAGGVAPYGVQIKYKGVEGTLPNILESIKYMDEQMARSTLTQFLQLGQTQSGSRALGETFIDFFGAATDSIVQWFCRTFNDHVIEDWVEWNYGPDEEFAPKLVATRRQSTEADVADLAALVEAGLVTADSDLEAWLRTKYAMPEKQITEAPAGKGYQYDLELGIMTIDERRAQLGLEPMPNGEGEGTVLIQDAVPPATGPAQDDPSQPSTGPVAARSKHGKRAVSKAATSADTPASSLPREPKPHETAVPWEEMDAAWTASRDAMVSVVLDAQVAWAAVLADQIAEAGGDVLKIASLAADAGDDVVTEIVKQLSLLIGEGIASAVAEADSQGVKIPAEAIPDTTEILQQLTDQASAILQVMAQDYSGSASREALRLTNAAVDPKDVATDVEALLAGLSDTYVRDQMSGLASSTMNEARFRVHEAAEGEYATSFQASELLDTDSCTDCTKVDGTVYATMAAARKDYPTGKYKGCQGRNRCRGTVMAIYDEEEAGA